MDIYGLNRDNGKENGNYYVGFRGWGLGVCSTFSGLLGGSGGLSK